MIASLAVHTLRECARRPFLYVTAVAVILLTLSSRLFLVFSFGAAETAAANLALSAVFLAGFLHAAFQATALVRADLERGTLALLLTTPGTLPAYVLGRFAGLAATSLALCAAVAIGTVALLALFPTSPQATAPGIGTGLLSGCLRAWLLVLVLDAAALAASAVATRITAPLALVALFLAGSLYGHWPVLPDFALFALEADARPSWLLVIGYAAVYASLFLLLALMLLARKRRLHGQR